MFQIPPAPKGIPIAWEGHYYGRDGESLAPLNLQEIEQIRNQGQQPDWSAQICKGATIEAITGDKSTYIKHRAFDDQHYKEMIIAFIKQYGSASRKDINDLLLNKLSDALDQKQKFSKIHNLLYEMSKKDKSIINQGSRKKSRWVLIQNE